MTNESNLNLNISMCTWDTIENRRAPITGKCLKSLFGTVNWNHHHFVFIDNGSNDPESLAHSEEWVRKINEVAPGQAERILLPENLGTAMAINKGWLKRRPGEGCLKVDSDITWEEPNWADRLEEAVARHRRGCLEQKALHQQNPNAYPPPMPMLSILALKRSDCGESMYRTDWGGSKLYEVHHLPGERWIDIEVVNHVVTSCAYHTPEAIERLGYLYQGEGRRWGWEDSLYCDRSHAVGMWTAFLHGFTIHHLDTGETGFQQWKEEHARIAGEWRMDLRRKYFSGEASVYYDENGNQTS
jgi:glycosyltransferase involved in cell wall biosynthesis